MGELLAALRGYGALGSLLLAVILFVLFYEKFEKPISRIYDLFSLVRRSWRKRAVKLAIQGNINSFSRSIDKIVPGSMPYSMRLEFVRSVDRAELLQGKNIVIVRIRDRKDDDKNLVHTMLACCPAILIPSARRYLDESMNKAIDLTMARKLLSALEHHSALCYLDTEVLPSEITDEPSLGELCKIFDQLDEHGVFARVVLRELRDFGAKVGSRYPHEGHKIETKEFVQYVHKVISRAPGVEMREIGYRGQYIASAFVLIGLGTRILSEGATPYLNFMRRLRSDRFEKAYLAARGGAPGTVESESIKMAERVSYLAERGGLAKRIKSSRYYAPDLRGMRREQILIEMEIMPPSPSEMQQGRLIEE